MVDSYSYYDEDGYKVQIGTVVAFNENFATPDNEDKTYKILEMPNCADTLIIREITDYSYDSDTGDETYVEVPNSDIEVKPYQVGAI